MSAFELDKFREEWKRELKRQTASDANLATQHNVEIKSHDCPEEKDVVKLNHFRHDDLPSSSNVDLSFEDEKSQDAFSDKPNASQVETHDTSCEYYPFKILTKFLNEAPIRKEAVETKKALKSPVLTFSKRKYFQEEVPTSDSANKKRKEETSKELPQVDKPMLDLFLADLDEINEIPFFDTTVPREVALNIFRHLDLKSLCHCSQVSRSWKSLANDELLWFNLCYELGYCDESETHVSDGNDWKGKVRRRMQMKQLLDVNWKVRIGKPYYLSFARGGVLCAVHSHCSTIVAGYTSCNVRMWDSKTGDTCTLNASNTALVIDDSTDEDLGLIRNEIQHICTTANVTVASFRHGFVDVWRNSSGTDPAYTIPFNNRNITSLSVQDVEIKSLMHHHSSVIAAVQGSRVNVSHLDDEAGKCLADFNMPQSVIRADWFGNCHSSHLPRLLITCNNSVHLKQFDPTPEAYRLPSSSIHAAPNLNMTEVHNIFWAPITTIGQRCSLNEVAVGFSLHTGASTQVKANVYDVTSTGLKCSLTGHTWFISTIHMPQSVPDTLVTGSGDRRIRLYDLRSGTFPTLTLVGHIAKVSCVEMDDWKVVSGDEAGFVCVWDQRMGRKLWDVHNRHPVDYCHFEDRLLISGHVPYQKFPLEDEFETVSSLRYRGTVQVYDFLANQQTQGIPDVCLSSYNEPEAYDYNIGLAMPYDKLT